MEGEFDYVNCKISQKILKELSKIKRHGKAKFIKWLKSTDFFKAPCSKDHHLNIEGGLAKHSWNVYQLFSEKNKRFDLRLPLETVIICGLLHDVCKVNFYRRKEQWDNEKQMKTWQYCYDDKFPIGHGEKSVIILQRFFKLSEKECCIIRWHMAGFDVSPYGRYSYHRAIEMYPACFALHSADYEAAAFLENDGNFRFGDFFGDVKCVLGHEVRLFNIGRGHFVACDKCKTYIFVGSNLMGNWREENEKIWRENSDSVKGYKFIK